ncbi:hypothetical protein D3C76_1452210 [compost metagenome]
MYHAGAEVAAAAIFQDVLQGQGAKVEAQGRPGFLRQGRIVLAPEVLAPVDVHVRVGAPGLADEDQLLFENLLDLQARPVLGLIDQRRIQHAELELT